MAVGGPSKRGKVLYSQHRSGTSQFGAEAINFLRAVDEITCGSRFLRLSCLSADTRNSFVSAFESIPGVQSNINCILDPPLSEIC